MLQCAAIHCSLLQRDEDPQQGSCFAVHRSILQCVAVCGGVLQCDSDLQHPLAAGDL